MYVPKAHVVAAEGMIAIKGKINARDKRKAPPVKIEARPVLAPASTPVFDSTKHVILLPPMIPPNHNPQPSTIIALLIRAISFFDSPFINPHLVIIPIYM
jgi:hypothetical protein